MKLKIWILLVLLLLIGGGVVIIKMQGEKPKRQSDFFKNDVKDIDVTDGKKY
ncbi:MAG: hypothetical protein M3Q07_21980 [Pseudobdellovibrionaceae bacterium]|nr:hypothetical protein [Pseudobdellovibrionaceae bacterium]